MKSRIKLVLFLIVGLGLLDSSSLYSQTEIGELMTRRKPNCFDVLRNACELLPQFHSTQKIDSVNAVLDYWEDRCGTTEEWLRFKTLLSIENRTSFVDSMVMFGGVLHYLMDYKNFALSDYAGVRSNYRREPYYPQVDILDINESTRYKDYTLKWAKRLLSQRMDLSERERFFLRIYSHDFDDTFSMLRLETFNNTVLQRMYYGLIESSTVNSWFRGEVSIGGWFPSENLAILGNHIGFGIAGGVQRRRWHALASINGHFGDSPKTREVNYKDSLYVSDKFSHISLALDLGLILFGKKQHKMELLGGVGYNSITVLEVTIPTNIDDPKSISRDGLSLSAGLGYRFEFPAATYIGLSAKYNFTHFNNKRGTDLTGNFLTIQLSLGFVSKDKKHRTRKLLELE